MMNPCSLLMEYGVKRSFPLLVLTFGALLAGCSGPRQALRQFQAGEPLARYTFDDPGEFEQGNYENATLRIRGGVYRILVLNGDNELWWGQWGEPVGDVVIETTVNQTSPTNENAYGVMCRVSGRLGQPVDASDLVDAVEEAEVEATDTLGPILTEVATDEATAEAETTEEAAETATSEATDEATEPAEVLTEEPTEDVQPTPVPAAANDGDGYLFLIQGSGSYGIFKATDRALTPLVNWQISDAINVGPNENELRAVCMGDYLAFYVNDTFVADVTDSTYSEGQVGLAASSANRLGLDVQFDDLTVSPAQ